MSDQTAENVGGKRNFFDFTFVLQRVREFFLNPKNAWAQVRQEVTTSETLLREYALPLGLIASLCGFIGMSIVGINIPSVGRFRYPLFASLFQQALYLGLVLGILYLLALVAEKLSPKFGGSADRTTAMKLIVYAYTPAFVAGIFSLIPLVGVLGSLISLYSLYLLYTGISELQIVPDDRRFPFFGALLGSALVLGLVVGFISLLFMPQIPTPTTELQRQIEQTLRP
jgi:hypothetical protein